MRRDDPHISGHLHSAGTADADYAGIGGPLYSQRNKVADPAYSEKLEAAAKERARLQVGEREITRCVNYARTTERELLVDALKALKMTGGEDFQAHVIERLENAVCSWALKVADARTEDAESYDRIKAREVAARQVSEERWADFLARKKAEMVPVDLIGQLEARLDALELRYMNRAREF